ncbi:DUF3592 domain-containing protein [Sphaerisporangium rufum]|uniref:DUF3592 domain-containing protein n=1 Tax=Sphaerisporangium rufum TaxID=1381558 RepID=UPI0019514035|nr:DUF3592 domain-containing protein [Sphaerisporangium rufum]
MLVLAGAGFLVMSVDDFIHVRRLRGQGIEVTALVHGVDHGSRGQGTVLVGFTTRKGEQITARIGFHRWSGEPSYGQTKTLIYDPDDPQGGVMDPKVRFEHVGHVLGCLAAILSFMGSVVVWRRTRPRRAAGDRRRPGGSGDAVSPEHQIT